MIYTRAHFGGIDIGGPNTAAGEFRNFQVVNLTTVFEPRQEMRLVFFSMGKATRDFGEVPGVTKNLDHNVIVELVRSPAVSANHGTAATNPDDSVALVDPEGRRESFFVYLNNGAMGSNIHSTTPDPLALWRMGFSVRRGFRKRWSWASAPRMGLQPVFGQREGLILRLAYMRVSNLFTRLSYTMEFMLADQGQ